MIFDVGRRYPRGYIHRHKFHDRPEGFRQEGPSEMHYSLNRIDSMVDGRSEDKSSYQIEDPYGGTTTHINKIIYDTHPHVAADNR